VRFLDEARTKSVWQATREDVDAYHRARRHDDAANRISAASWNRAVAALDKLYRWGVEDGIILQSPFTYRDVWRRLPSGRGRTTIVTLITARKLPTIIAFLDFIVTRRAEMAEADWWPKFGRAWSRITQQVLPAFSDAVVADAHEKAKALVHQPYLPLEATPVEVQFTSAGCLNYPCRTPLKLLGRQRIR
jgi:hypothetical protein